MLERSSYTPKKTTPVPASSAQSAAAQRAAQARILNQFDSTRQDRVTNTPVRQQLAASGNLNPTISEINAANRSYVENYVRPNIAAARAPVQKTGTPANRNTGSSYSYGGGGGGGSSLPQYTQQQVDWMAQLLAQGGPQPYAQLDLPDYQAFAPKPFDDSYFVGLQGSLDQAVNTDLGQAQQGTNNLMQFLQSNYTNAFNNPNNTYATAGQAPGMDQQAMARLMQNQGVNPNALAQQQQAQATADAGFGNLWKSLAGNEDRNQQNRLGAAQLSGTDAANRIRALGLGGTTGINMQRGQAKSAYDQQVQQWAREDAIQQQQIAQQEAMANWQQGNSYSDQQQQYRNAQIQAMLGLLPELKGATGLNLPTLQQLGWGGQANTPAAAAPPVDPADPLGWKKIDADLRAMGLR